MWIRFVSNLECLYLCLLVGIRSSRQFEELFFVRRALFYVYSKRERHVEGEGSLEVLVG